jgi:hypothetical protein
LQQKLKNNHKLSNIEAKLKKDINYPNNFNHLGIKNKTIAKNDLTKVQHIKNVSTTNDVSPEKQLKAWIKSGQCNFPKKFPYKLEGRMIGILSKTSRPSGIVDGC